MCYLIYLNVTYVIFMKYTIKSFIFFLCPLLSLVDTGIMVKAAALSSTLSHLVSDQ